MANVDFLQLGKFWAAREQIYLHKLIFDLYLAAGNHDYLLHYYQPTVDQDGWDFAISDNELERRIQLKTRSTTATTKNWPLQKQLLRPDFEISSKLVATDYYVEHGLGGGAIVITIDPENADEPTYHYTDFQIIYSFARGIISRNRLSRTTALKALKKLNGGSGSDKISIAESLFVTPRSAEHLLAFARLYTDFTQFWRSNLVQLMEHPPLFNHMAPMLGNRLNYWVADGDIKVFKDSAN